MPDIDDPSRFVQTRVVADAGRAAQLRAEFASWLGGRFSLGPESFNDVLLAVNEALANAAEFAYVDSPQHGTLELDAAYDAVTDALAVTVTDHGRWRNKAPQPAGLQTQRPRHSTDAGARRRSGHRPRPAGHPREADLDSVEPAPLHHLRHSITFGYVV